MHAANGEIDVDKLPPSARQTLCEALPLNTILTLTLGVTLTLALALTSPDQLSLAWHEASPKAKGWALMPRTLLHTGFF